MTATVLGGSVFITATFADALGNPIDTTGMRARFVRSRSADAEQEVAVQGAGATGEASARFTPTAAGFFVYRFWRPGAVPLAYEGGFDVAASGLGTDPA